MRTVWHDLRYATRLLKKRPGIALVVILTLTLAIGANTAIFSVVNAVLLRPLPYGEPERLVMIESQYRGASIGVSFADYQDWLKQNQVFDDIAFFNLRWNANLDLEKETETLSLTFGTANLFSTLRVAPLIGHGPQAGESDTVLISHGLWQRRYGSDPTILGRKISVDATPLTVIGVMPPDFRFPFQTDLWWLTDRYFDREHRGQRRDQTIARLNPQINVSQAHAEMAQLATRLAQTYPDTNEDVTAAVVPLREFWSGKLNASLWLLLGACGLVLLIACANIANLMLVQASSRERELAVRTALGASRWRLIRQSFSEALLLSVVGCLCGLALGAWSLKALVALLPAELLPFFIKINLDWRVLLFTSGVSFATGIVFGIIPALKAVSIDLNQSLKDGGKASTGRRSQRIGRLLVVSEVALAIVLLVGGGLMLRSLVRLQNTQTGFAVDNILHLEINPTYRRSQDYNVEFMSRHYQRLLQRLSTVPGVVAVAANSDPPFVGQKPWYRGEFSIEHQSLEEQKQNPMVNYQAVSPDYFKVMSIPILRGRAFSDADNVRPEGRRDVAIINQRFAQRMWPNADPIGKRLNCDEDSNACAEIVGIVGDVKHNNVTDEFGYDLYFACYQSYSKQNHFLARTQGDPSSLAPEIKRAIWEVAPDTGVFNVTPVARLTANSIWQQRVWSVMLGVFSAVALVMAAAGIYGVMAYFVAQRTQEIGIRVALGAQASDVLRLVLRSGMALALVGLVIGLVGAFAVTRLMSSLLYETTPTDPLTFCAVTLGLLFVAFFACYIPARRATRVDPLVALRSE